ncbi:MAG: 1-(5-phosphoribosyl)-5-[(5-phosphoribosylamino)methylideneamino] imidazole-4-carboxamide isomerase [bacterium]|nr:1-(5-phosphoribosyl)-5-[(5-phosphoribosylamino)methylideneamino] imidazole-4-carboxamide isomerase [bacterium]
MLIYPAIDLRQGKGVRLKQGERRRETIYSDDPLATAAAFVAQGATWLHVIDLDGAFAAEQNNRPLIKKMAALTVRMQCGGGIRTLADMAEFLEAGVSRVILGTVAVRQPEIVKQAVQQFGAPAIAVAIDARDGKVAVDGWEKSSASTVLQLAQQLGEYGVELAVYTDIARDGMLNGVNLPALQTLLNGTKLRLIASGGVRDLNDLQFLRKLNHPRLDGVIIGRALYEGTLQLGDALKICQSENIKF